MENITRREFETWMERIMERLDKLSKQMGQPEKEKEVNMFNGERLYDNQDMCLLLNCSKRTVQRYRVSGKLPCRRIDQKTYYLESDVIRFIAEYLQKPTGKKGK
jgi:hypothetical protein